MRSPILLVAATLASAAVVACDVAPRTPTPSAPAESATSAAPISDESADDAWAEISALAKSRDDAAHDACVARMREYRDFGGARAVVRLRGLTTSKVDRIATSAIRIVAETRDPDLHRWLARKIGDKDLADPRDGRPAVYLAVLDALVAYGETNRANGVQPRLDTIIRKYTDTRPEYATRAVRACGTVPDKFTVESLIALCERLDARGGKRPSAEAGDNRAQVRVAAIETLDLLTGMNLADTRWYREWWTEKAKTFVFPKAPGPSATPEIAGGLSEFRDEAFGWSVKRPDGDGWTFEEPEMEGQRIGLINGGEDERIAHAFFSVSVRDPSRPGPKDVPGFVEWVKSGPFANEPEMGKVEVSEKTCGGTRWTIVSRRREGWAESRYYIAPLGPDVLYVYGFVRPDAADELKRAFWASIESTAITGK